MKRLLVITSVIVMLGACGEDSVRSVDTLPPLDRSSEPGMYDEEPSSEKPYVVSSYCEYQPPPPGSGTSASTMWLVWSDGTRTLDGFC